MRRTQLTEADIVTMRESPWLARQPEAFRAEIFARSLPQDYAAGEALYRLGDPPGGIYGLMSGVLTATAAPGEAMPQVLHVATPGLWTGEAPYMLGIPRLIELRAVVPCRTLHLPLDVMEQMTVADPRNARRFGGIPVINLQLLLRMVSDLLIKDTGRRIAAVLLRATGEGAVTLPLSQDELGDMACATRKQVNFTLRRFAAAGWVSTAYRSVTITDRPALSAHVAGGED